MRQGLRTLADLVERIEVDGVVVNDVSLEKYDSDGFRVELSVDLSADAAVAAPGVAVGATTDGGLARGGVGAADPPTDRSTELSPAFGKLSAQVGGTVGESLAVASTSAVATGEEAGGPAAEGGSSTDEPVVCRVEGCEETFSTDHGMKIHATKAHQAADGSAPSPHRDPERLQEVYEACDTFEAMRDELGVDVTAQTVRRSMMRLGVHDPEAALLTGSPDGGASTEQPPEDGEDQRTPDLTAAVADVLPESVDGETLVESVRTASTLYEVQRDIGMAREEVQTLLAELGLLDLVHGRVATKAERDIEKDEIERRILAAATGGAGDADHAGEQATAE